MTGASRLTAGQSLGAGDRLSRDDRRCSRSRGGNGCRYGSGGTATARTIRTSARRTAFAGAAGVAAGRFAAESATEQTRKQAFSAATKAQAQSASDRATRIAADVAAGRRRAALRSATCRRRAALRRARIACDGHRFVTSHLTADRHGNAFLNGLANRRRDAFSHRVRNSATNRVRLHHAFGVRNLLANRVLLVHAFGVRNLLADRFGNRSANANRNLFHDGFRDVFHDRVLNLFRVLLLHHLANGARRHAIEARTFLERSAWAVFAVGLAVGIDVSTTDASSHCIGDLNGFGTFRHANRISHLLFDHFGHHSSYGARNAFGFGVRNLFADLDGNLFRHAFGDVGGARNFFGHATFTPNLAGAGLSGRFANDPLRQEAAKVRGAGARIEAAFVALLPAHDRSARLAIRFVHPFAATLGHGLGGANGLANLLDAVDHAFFDNGFASSHADLFHDRFGHATFHRAANRLVAGLATWIDDTGAAFHVLFAHHLLHLALLRVAVLLVHRLAHGVANFLLAATRYASGDLAGDVFRAAFHHLLVDGALHVFVAGPRHGTGAFFDDVL